MDYKDIYFRIKAGYNWGEGMQEEQKIAFFTEIQLLFEGAGWIVAKDDISRHCPTLHKGLSRLYCHPMNISGELAEDLIEEVASILKLGETFKHYATDEYETIRDMPNDIYQAYLDENIEQITADILNAFTTKRRNLYYDEYNTGKVLAKVSKEWHIHRIQNGENWRQANKLESKVINDIFQKLVQIGYIVSGKVKNGNGYRTNKKAA